MQTLLHNTRAYKLLQAEAEKGRLAHAYLLLFDDARNLRAALKTFAKPILCAGVEREKTARICTLIENESFSDCLFYPSENGKKFVVEDAERVAEECALQAVEGERKVFVIGDFSEATPAAQNKLLKLLEEPPEGVVFLLGATTAFSVLTTVLSRVEKLEISAFSVEEVFGALSRIYEGGRYGTNEFSLCAAACGGSLGEAQNALEGGDAATLIADAFSLALAEEKMLPSLVRRIGETKQKKRLLSLLRIVYRDALLVKEGICGVFLTSELGNVEKLAQKRTVRALLFAQKALTEAERELFFNAVFPQCLETLLAGIYRENQKKE